MNKQENQATSNQQQRDDKLTASELEFAMLYIQYGDHIKAVEHLSNLQYLMGKAQAKNKIYRLASYFMRSPRVQAEIKRIMNEMENKLVANANEVMEYFTSVMRGEVKDQFGLDAPLAERTKAAQELAKRTIDIENRKAGEPDQLVAIQLDWTR